MDEYTKEPKELPPKVESPEHDSMEDAEDGVVANVAPLKRDLQGRHMQMIAIVSLSHCSEFLEAMR